MDWPSRSIWSRIRWLRVALTLWWERQRRRGRSTPATEPASWSQFEDAFWSYVRGQAPHPHHRG